jgi:tetratricopeptide (TPR) repeat protein
MFTRALEIHPQFHWRRYRLAHLDRIQKRYTDSIANWEQILAGDPSQSDAYYQRVVRELNGDHQQALLNFDRYRERTKYWVRTYPKNGLGYTSKAAVLIRLGRPQLALEALHRVSAMDPVPHYGFARVFSLLGRPAEALQHLRRAIDGGFGDYVWIMIDPDLESLRSKAEFQALMAKKFRS